MILKIIENKGIHITRGKLTFSIQISKYNYCSNKLTTGYFTKAIPLEERYENSGLNIESNDCEVAVTHKDRGWITNLVYPINGKHIEGECDVKGYVPIEEALKNALNWELEE